MTYIGESIDAEGNKIKIKNVMVYNDDGTRTMTMYMGSADGGELSKVMEIHYTKQPRGKNRQQPPHAEPAQVVD